MTVYNQHNKEMMEENIRLEKDAFGKESQRRDKFSIETSCNPLLGVLHQEEKPLVKNSNGGEDKQLVKTPTVALSEGHQGGNGGIEIDQEYLQDK